ncbi:hypothetical protein GX48_07745 [Paracoccidioides brasiliensis]|nr:hypothetical protein GX48_07745 [Paracoccidioides brasiliensis]
MDKNKKPGMTIIHHCCNSSSAGIAQRQLLSQLHPREKFTTKCKKVREKKKVGAQWIPKLQSSQISQIKSYISTARTQPVASSLDGLDFDAREEESTQPSFQGSQAC